MNENDLRAIALFFYYSFLNEGLARQACFEAVKLTEKKIKAAPSVDRQIHIAKVCNDIFKSYTQKQKKSQVKEMPFKEMIWVLPENLSLAPWRELLKKASREEVSCLIFVHILKFAEKGVAEALGLSIGSLRYRLGRALRVLGNGQPFAKESMI